MRLVTFLVLAALLAACALQQAPLPNISTNEAVVRVAEKGLPQSIAQLRFRQVVGPHYKLRIRLNETGEPFSGDIDISFGFKAQGSALTLDFAGGEVETVLLNGKPANYDYNDFFLSFSEDQFSAGVNTLSIRFRHRYSSDGSGLYFFKDPLDQTVYTYSDLEPFDANKIFPLFDQPDLKATYTFDIDAPQKWQVVSTMRETSIDQSGNRKVWHFPATPLINSYAVSIHAGEYAMFDLGEFEGIPLRLFSRQSIRDTVPVAEWDKTTRQGFAFFNDYFGIPYPFGKYDQLAVPDFNSGAMENIGAVTFADQFCCRKSQRSLTDKSFFLNSVLHEQAHMWFGNLVTMKWWDDIWLNESFAEYAGYLALESGTDFKDPWLEFLWQRKTWGYRDDDYVTTHPIQFPVENTEYVMTAIDGITYAKGASLLRQLSYFIGDDKFKMGVQAYMKKYAYGNTQFNDLLQELSITAEKPLKNWAEQWLKSTGVNRVTTELICSNNKVDSLTLVQSKAGEVPAYRTHRLNVALYDLVDNKVQQPEVVGILMEGERTELTQLAGRNCPALILPNIGDYAYLKLILDPRSRETLKEHLSEISDPHARALFWIALWDGVNDGTYSLEGYFEIAFEQILKEKNAYAINGFRKAVNQTRSWLYSMETDKKIERFQRSFNHQIIQLAKQKMTQAAAGSDDFHLWLQMYYGNARTEEQLENISAWLNSGEINGWKVDQRRRWFFLRVLAQHRYANIVAWLESEFEKDSSSTGKKYYLDAKTRFASIQEKEIIFERAISKNNKDKLGDIRSTIGGLTNENLAREQEQLLKTIVATVVSKSASLNSQLIRVFSRNNFPVYYSCSTEWSEFVSTLLLQSKDIHNDLKNSLLESEQNNQRCMRARALFLN